MAWTTPRTWTSAVLLSTELNAHVRDNLVVLRAGGIALASQVIGDLPYASSTTQFGRIAAVATGQVLKSAGVGVVPAWGTINVAALSDASNVALLNAATNTFTGEHAFSATTASLRQSTSDGADNKRIIIAGGGAISDSRGAYITLHGNEYATDPGEIVLLPGNVSYVVRVAGLFMATRLGVHNFTAGGNSDNAIYVTNTTSDTNARAVFRAMAGTTLVQLTAYAQGYSTSGLNVAASGNVYANGAGGLGLVADHAEGDIRFYTGGATLRATVFDTGGFALASTTDPGAGNLLVAGGTIYLYPTFSSSLVGSAATIALAAAGFGPGAALKLTSPVIANTTVSLVLGDAALTAGDYGTASGPYLRIHNNDNATTPAAASLGLADKDSTVWYLWSQAGVLRIHTALPTNALDGAGTIVGTQTSTLDTKTLLGHDLTPAAALETIRRTPVKRFRYNNGAYHGSTFHGVVADWSPEFAMDPDAAHPNGRSFNPVSAFGFSVLAMQALDARLRALEAH